MSMGERNELCRYFLSCYIDVQVDGLSKGSAYSSGLNIVCFQDTEPLRATTLPSRA